MSNRNDVWKNIVRVDGAIGIKRIMRMEEDIKDERGYLG